MKVVEDQYGEYHYKKKWLWLDACISFFTIPLQLLAWFIITLRKKNGFDNIE